MFNKHKSQPQPEVDPVEQAAIEIMGPLPDQQRPQHVQTPELPIEPPAMDETADLEEPAPVQDAPEAIENIADSPNIDDPETAEAVKEIEAQEADLALQNQDNVTKSVPKKHGRLASMFVAWWGNKKLRFMTIMGLIAIVVALFIVPATRYTILNTCGLRASTSFTVIDIKSGRPINNATVEISGQSAITDKQGYVKLDNLKLGNSTLYIKKRSFAVIDQPVTIGWGSNPYDSPFQMTPVGSQYTFIFVDYLSGKTVTKAEATDGDSVAIANNSGQAILTIEPKADVVQIAIKSDSYRPETVSLNADDKQAKTIYLVPAKQDVFVSKRSGKYDLYKKDADGKNEAVIFAATGSEQANMSVLPHPKQDVAALVSTREGKRNTDGYLLNNLYIVDVKGKTASKVVGTESERIRLLGWIGDNLVFVKVVAGPSGNMVGRQRIITYDLNMDKQTEIATANYFNDVELINDKIYYSISGDSKFYQSAIGKTATVILSKEAWGIYRTSFNKAIISAVNNAWFDISLDNFKINSLSGPPAVYVHRSYIDSPDGSKSVWIDNRDGKGVLIIFDKATGSEKVLFSKAGLNYPINWLSNKHLLFRVSNSQETADYAINIEAGAPKKVSDVTNTEPTGRWYYY